MFYRTMSTYLGPLPFGTPSNINFAHYVAIANNQNVNDIDLNFMSYGRGGEVRTGGEIRTIKEMLMSEINLLRSLERK